MTESEKAPARRGLHDAGITAELLITIGAGDISGGKAIDETAIEWLGRQLYKAINLASESLDGACRLEGDMSTRRHFLALTTGAVSVGAVLPRREVHAADHPDAELLAACAAFDKFEHQIRSLYYGEFQIVDDHERDAAIDPIQAAQDEPLLRLCGIPAKTMEGLRAKARSLVLWDEFAIEVEPECTHDRIRSSLLRDLIG